MTTAIDVFRGAGWTPKRQSKEPIRWIDGLGRLETPKAGPGRLLRIGVFL